MIKWYKRWRAGKIEDPIAREKRFAELNNEAWVKVINVEFEDPTNPSVGAFEMDWNDQFVDQLQEAGYSGRTPEDVVDMWFKDLCRGVVDDQPT